VIGGSGAFGRGHMEYPDRVATNAYRNVTGQVP
jgi:hypothetical protein